MVLVLIGLKVLEGQKGCFFETKQKNESSSGGLQTLYKT